MPYREFPDNVRDLAAAVILQAMEDFKSGPGRRGQYRLRQLEARDFLCGFGKFDEWRNMWCREMGLAPDRLDDFVKRIESGPPKSAKVARKQLQPMRTGRLN